MYIFNCIKEKNFADELQNYFSPSKIFEISVISSTLRTSNHVIREKGKKRGEKDLVKRINGLVKRREPAIVTAVSTILMK